MHYLKQKFDSRGYDSRALELAEAVIHSMPPDKLSEAMTKDPTEILALVLARVPTVLIDGPLPTLPS